MKKIIITAIIIIIGLVGFAAYKLGQDGFDIRLENKTNQEVSGLYVTYENIKTDIILPAIPAGEEYKIHVDPKANSTEDFDEAALKLEYIDVEGNIHTEYVIGYFEQGYSGNADIKITAVDTDGKLEVEIIDNISLY